MVQALDLQITTEAIIQEVLQIVHQDRLSKDHHPAVADHTVAVAAADDHPAEVVVVVEAAAVDADKINRKKKESIQTKSYFSCLN